MTYPGIDPSGSGPAESGRAPAGTDLAAAVEMLRSRTTACTVVRLAAVPRRRSAVDETLAVLGSGDRGDELLSVPAMGLADPALREPRCRDAAPPRGGADRGRDATP